MSSPVTSYVPGATARPATGSAATRPRAPWPVAAGATYVGAWVVGLTAFVAAPTPAATDAEVAGFYAEHAIPTAVQSVLVHGVAAVALAGLLVGLARRRAVGRLANAAGSIAVALSVVQCVLGVWRSTIATGSTTNHLVAAIDRTDGVKMLALAVLLAAGTIALSRSGTFGRTMIAVGATGSVALVIAGVTYAAGAGVLVAAAVALVILLAWVGTTGWVIAARGR
jgi:hypothetical protein